MQHFNATREVTGQDQIDLCHVRTDQILQLLDRVKATEITDKRYDVSADTSELKTTLERVRKVLAFGAIKLIEGSLDVFCIVAIQATLDQLKKILLQQEACVTFSSWCDTKIKLYNLDLQLYFQLDQVVALFAGNNAFDAIESFTDNKNTKMWLELFGRQVRLVPCNEFLTKFVAYLNADDKLYNYTSEELGFIAHFLDFTRDDLISPYKVHIFTRWFGPLPNCFDRLLESLRTGYLTGFMSAHEANWMLRKKPAGTFLIRFSKSQAGCFAVTFVDSKCQVKHSLLYSLTGDQWGLTLKNPPKVYKTLSEFVLAHANNLSSPLGNKWMSQLDKPKTSPILAGNQGPGRSTGEDPMESPDSPPESHVTSLRTSNPKIKRDTSQHYFPLGAPNNNGAVVDNNATVPAMGGEKNVIHVVQNMGQPIASKPVPTKVSNNMAQNMYTQSNYTSAQNDDLIADPALTRVIRDSTFTPSSIANYQQINQALLNYQGSPDQYQMYHADTTQQVPQFSAVQLSAQNLLLPHRPAEQSPSSNTSTSNGLKSPKPSEPSCTVCMDHPRTTLFLECAHRACCKECSRKVTFCPVCRQPITRVVDIYTP